MSDAEEKQKVKVLVNAGSELAGAAVSGALGFLAGGPTAAALFGASGLVVSKALVYVGNELSSRLLGPREKMRIGATLALAGEEINERIKNGETIRSDDFFSKDNVERSKAEELAESTLLKSQREAEEKKVPFLAHFLANMSFSTEISVPLGQQILKAVDSLTYRQLCILRLAAVNKDTNLNLRATDYREQPTVSRDLYQLLHECLDLDNRAYISFGNTAVLGLLDMNPSTIKVQGLGVDIHNFLQLWKIPDEDIKPLIDELSK